MCAPWPAPVPERPGGGKAQKQQKMIASQVSSLWGFDEACGDL